MQDTCRTADDVWRKIDQARRFRARMYPRVVHKIPKKGRPVLKRRKPVQHDQHVHDWLAWTSRHALSMHTIAYAVADHVGLPRGHMMGIRQHHISVDARHLAWILIRTLLPKFSSNQIGHAFHRDHTTVLWGLYRYAWTLEQLRGVNLPMPYLIEYARQTMCEDAYLHRYRLPQFSDWLKRSLARPDEPEENANENAGQISCRIA